MKRTDKEKLVQFWMDKELHDDFKEICEKLGFNQSAWLRAKIKMLVTDNSNLIENKE